MKLFTITLQLKHGPRANPRNHTKRFAVVAATEEAACEHLRTARPQWDEPIINVEESPDGVCSIN